MLTDRRLHAEWIWQAKTYWRAVVSLMIALLLSLGAVYGLNRYLGPIEDPPTSSLRHSPTN